MKIKYSTLKDGSIAFHYTLNEVRRFAIASKDSNNKWNTRKSHISIYAVPTKDNNNGIECTFSTEIGIFNKKTKMIQQL